MSCKTSGQLKESGLIVLDSQEIYEHYEVNTNVSVEIREQSARSIQHNRLYWGGLIRLMEDYWTVKAGLLRKEEIKAIEVFVVKLSKKYGAELIDDGRDFLIRLAQKRAEKITPVEPSKAQIREEIHEYIKTEIGAYETIQGHSGARKATKSTSFAKMTQEEFNEFYKAAFTVCWNHILSSKFDDEAQAQQAIDQLMGMG